MAYSPYVRPIEVLSDRQTGETILDEALRLMKSQQDGPGGGIQGEKMGVGSWVDLMSGMSLQDLRVVLLSASQGRPGTSSKSVIN